MMRLALDGVITGAQKSLLPGKLVTSFIMGSRAIYEWAHDNPALELRGSDFINDPRIIADNDRMVSVNSALAVDLTGQVAADTLLGKLFSGIGGQVDFVRGAARSRGGRSIIALRSTAQRGSVSRIRSALEEGAGIVTSRGDVRYVVTEYGIADLWGRSVQPETKENRVEVPVQITFRGMSPMPSIGSLIVERASRLERFVERITRSRWTGSRRALRHGPGHTLW
jgi:acyl-CoA hydrolase